MAVVARTGSANVSCVVWEWQRDDGGYSPYPPEISSQMESAFGSGSGSCVMTDYTVHFSTMRQKNSNSGELHLDVYCSLIWYQHNGVTCGSIAAVRACVRVL